MNGQDARGAVIAEAMEREGGAVPQWFALAFNGGEKGKGIAFVRAPGFVTAVWESHQLGINPGGSVHGVGSPDFEPPVEDRNRLLVGTEAEKYRATFLHKLLPERAV